MTTQRKAHMPCANDHRVNHFSHVIARDPVYDALGRCQAASMTTELQLRQARGQTAKYCDALMISALPRTADMGGGDVLYLLMPTT
jgi:hypothetical protein